jgi:hypothetical protein
MSKLSDWMLKDHRQYVIDMVKAPLFFAIIKYGNRYPEPTHDNCNCYNSHYFIDVADELLARNTNLRLDGLFKAMKRIFIGEYEHDETYARLLDWIMDKLYNGIQSRKIKLTLPGKNTVYWNEGGTYGSKS